MKILHFITDFRRGGESTILSAFLPWLETQGTENVLCCMASHSRGKSDTLVNIVKDSGIRVYDLRITSPWKIWRVLGLLWVLWKERPDILHTYLFHASVTGRVLGSLWPGLVVSSSVVSSDEWKKPWHSFLEGLTSRLCRGILVNAKNIADRLVERDGVDARKLTLVYNGADTRRLKDCSPLEAEALRARLGIESTDFVVGWVGRFHPAKDPETMLRAFFEFHRKVPQSKLLLLGEGELLEKCKQLARPFQSSVRFLGNIEENLRAHYALFGTLAISSKLEGIPAVVFEAMYCNVPLVSFRIGGIREVVSDEMCFFANEHTALGLTNALLARYRTPATEIEYRNKLAHTRLLADYGNEKSYRGRMNYFRSLVGTEACRMVKSSTQASS